MTLTQIKRPLLDPCAQGERGAAINVILVDDDALILRVIGRSLRRNGCDIRAFTNPEEALMALRADPAWADVLVTDHCMPPMTGVELATTARGCTRELPILLLTGLSARADIKLAKARGVITSVLEKPISGATLSVAVARLARKQPRRVMAKTA